MSPRQLSHHYPLSLPNGFVTTVEGRIKHIEENLATAFDNPVNINSYFERNNVEEDETVFNSRVKKLFG